jgi:hypothetical protein
MKKGKQSQGKEKVKAMLKHEVKKERSPKAMVK